MKSSLLQLVTWLALGSIGLAADPPPIRILPLGNSITNGFSVPATGSGYRLRLFNLLTNAGYQPDFVGTLTDTSGSAIPDPDHEGHNGFRIDQVNDGIEEWLPVLDDPDLVLLHIGTNDFSQNFQTGSASVRLENLIEHIATLRPHAKILVGSLIPRTDDANLESAQQAFNAAIPGIVDRQTALGHEVYFVDLHSALAPADLADGVHPNQVGYDKMADVWFPAITNLVSPYGDANPPEIARLHSIDLQHLSLTFSKPLEDAAADPAHFSLDLGVDVIMAALDDASKRTITLTTTPQASGTSYSLAVDGVRDRTPMHHEIAPGTTVKFATAIVQNGGFESDYAAWMPSGNQEIKISAAATEGSKMVVFNAGQAAPNGVLSQSFSTIPGATYILKFDTGVRAFNSREQRLNVMVQGATNLLTETISLTGLGAGRTFWVSQSYTFVADGENAVLTFRDVSPTSDNIDLYLDHVRMTREITHALTVTSSPSPGVPMAISPPDTSGAGDGVTDFTRSYQEGTVVNLTAPTTMSGRAFQKWQLDGDDVSTNASISINLTADATLNAVYVAGAPFITQHPMSLTTAVGRRATFEVLADGEAPVTYQWRFNGAPISGAISNVYVLENPVLADAGEYDVVVSNNNGSIVSTPAVLTVLSGGTLANGSFESDYNAWTPSGNQVIASDPYPATDGSKVVVFNGGQSAPNGVLWQAFTTIPGESYTLVFDAGVRAFTSREQRIGVTVEGANTLISHAITLQGAGGQTRWATATYSFVADSEVTLLIFRDLSTSTTNLDLLLDRVRLTRPITHTLNVTSSPETGVSMIVSPSDLTGAGNGVTTFSRSYDDGTVVNVTAPETAGDGVFQRWRLGGQDLSTNRSLSITLQNDADLEAVYVAGAPVITQQPAGLTTSVGERATFSIAASGMSPLAYQWRFNGVDLPGATETSYTIEKASGDDAGNYDVVVSNGAGMVTSATAVLTVIDEGTLANGSFEADYDAWTIAGNQVIVSSPPYTATDGASLVVFNGGQSAPNAVLAQAFTTVVGETYVLEFDVGARAFNTAEQRMNVTVEGASNTLLAQTISIFGIGNGDIHWSPQSFTFVAESETTVLSFRDVSPTSANVDLLLDHVRVRGEMDDALVITQSPRSLTTSVGEPATFTVQANGMAPLAYQWRVDGSDISGANDSTYTIASVTAADAGEYDVVVSDSSASVASQPAILTVIEAGVIANGSFESDYAAWTATGNQVVVASPPFPTTDGTKVLVFNGGQNPPNGVLWQAFASNPGDTYVIQFDAGARSFSRGDQRLGVTVEGSQILLTQTVTIAGPGGGGTNWVSPEYSFVADSDTTILTFRDLSPTTANIDLLLDHVRVSH